MELHALQLLRRRASWLLPLDFHVLCQQQNTLYYEKYADYQRKKPLNEDDKYSKDYADSSQNWFRHGHAKLPEFFLDNFSQRELPSTVFALLRFNI
jgi:hypothetical protein